MRELLCRWSDERPTSRSRFGVELQHYRDVIAAPARVKQRRDHTASAQARLPLLEQAPAILPRMIPASHRRPCISAVDYCHAFQLAAPVCHRIRRGASSKAPPTGAAPGRIATATADGNRIRVTRACGASMALRFAASRAAPGPSALLFIGIGSAGRGDVLSAPSGAAPRQLYANCTPIGNPSLYSRADTSRA